ncbi:MAG TPA: hypothetical protein PKC43_08960 [Phycisphaerales bacterium]|nr:hypothetical protein [Phycisphaerales bacterium]HMP37566.1 hypothetical protein [Phycisphaerales bacterium]
MNQLARESLACLSVLAEAPPAGQGVPFVVSIEVVLFGVAVLLALAMGGFFAVVLLREGGRDGDGRVPGADDQEGAA